MQLVYLSPVPWRSFAQRPHKFVDWFQETMGGDVLWVEPYPCRFPKISDFQRSSAKPHTQTDIQVLPGISVLSPRAVPVEPLPFSGAVNYHLFWKQSFKTIEAFLKKGPTALVIGKPAEFALQVMARFDFHSTVYDAMDDFPAFYQGYSSRAMARREELIVKAADHVLVSSTALLSRWHDLKPAARLVPNALDEKVLPERISKVMPPARVFGYVGTIAEWFDWPWVVTLAQTHPNDIIRLVGPMYNAPGVTLPANIELLGERPQADALTEVLSFDVAIIPFLRTKLTFSVDPIKYYEYRALGVPILSTRFGEMCLKAPVDGVVLCDDPTSLPAAITEVLKINHTTEESSRFAINNTWRVRFSTTIDFFASV